jgi:hypothetical protein
MLLFTFFLDCLQACVEAAAESPEEGEHPRGAPHAGRRGGGVLVTLVASVADPDPGASAFLTPGSGMGKKSGSGFCMNNAAHISESIETIFWVKILKFFDADSGSGMEKFGTGNRDLGWKKFGSEIRVKHPGFASRHC